MDSLDNLPSREHRVEPEGEDVKQPSLLNVVNFRDNHGRTGLHVAAAHNNMAVCEILLFLRANPHVEDVYGQRPIEFCSDEAVISLLSLKLEKTVPL